MTTAIQYFLLGASFMFTAFVAWVFRRNRQDRLARLVMALMIVMAVGFLKDALVLSDISNLTDLTLRLTTSIDVVAVPLYACILIELCNPGKLTVKLIIWSEIPFCILPLLLAVFHHPVFYYIDMGLAILLALSTATWTCFAIPRYHHHLKATFSYDEDINLKWLQSILWAFFLILSVWVVSCITYSPWFDVAYMLCMLILWMFVCYFIYKHKSVVDELRPLEKTEPIKFDNTRSEVFARIKKLIEEERIYLNPLLKLSDIAQLANTNRTYASAYFKFEVGSTFYDHINGLRIKYALTLLADPSRRIDEIAELSGFNSRQSFHRVFIAFQGITPNDYRLRI